MAGVEPLLAPFPLVTPDKPRQFGGLDRGPSASSPLVTAIPREAALARCRARATEEARLPDVAVSMRRSAAIPGFRIAAIHGTPPAQAWRYSHTMKDPAVYILASGRNGTLYTGVTSNLHHRTHEHKLHIVPGFTKDHRVDQLVWFEPHPTMESAIRREKSIKGWRRAWKLQLIEGSNPCWRDLSDLL